MELYLIRHTNPEVEKGVVYGQLDLDVAGTFHREAEAIRKQIPERLGAVWSSPLKRCQKLAGYLFNQQEIMYDDRLKELVFGEWEGLMWDDINPTELDVWMKNFVNEGPSGGESMMQLQNRVTSFLDDIGGQNHEPAVLVTHAGVIRIIYSMVMDKPLKTVFDLKLEYGAVVRCNLAKGFFEVLK